MLTIMFGLGSNKILKNSVWFDIVYIISSIGFDKFKISSVQP